MSPRLPLVLLLFALVGALCLFAYSDSSATRWSRPLYFSADDDLQLSESEQLWHSYGKNRVCALDRNDHTEDGQGSAEIILDVPDLSDCQHRCLLASGTCKAIEWHESAGRCEVWTKQPHGTLYAPGYECLRIHSDLIQVQTQAEEVQETLVQPTKRCYEPLSDVGSVSATVGSALSSVEYMSLSDCSAGCSDFPECNSYLVCASEQTCYLQSERLTQSSPTKHMEGCTSYMAAPCKEHQPPRQATSVATTSVVTTPSTSTTTLKTTSVVTTPSTSTTTLKPEQPEHLKSDWTPTKPEPLTIVARTISSTSTPTTALPGPAHAANPAPMHDDIRSSYVWTPYRHYDLPDRGDIEKMNASDILQVKLFCRMKDDCAGFSVRKGLAWLKTAPKPLQREDLRFMGDDDVMFFTLSPPREMAWREFRDCDYPNRGDIETVDSADIKFLKHRAEQHGYAGFGVRGRQAFMKGSDWPLKPSDLTCSSKIGPCSFYLPVPEEQAVGISPYVNTHQAYGATCADTGVDCKELGCCKDPGKFCYETSSSSSRCLAKCSPGSSPDEPVCRVVGSPRVLKTSLFCFSVVLAHSDDFKLVNSQLKDGVGLALCEEYMVFSNEKTMLSNGDFTVPLAALANSSAEPNRWAYQEVWHLIFDHFIWRQHNWIVQVNAQTLLFANELKMRLHDHAADIEKTAAGKGVYMQTCAGKQRFTKAVYIISQDGVGSMSFHRDKCKFKGVEDAAIWTARCLEAVQAHPFQLSQLFVDTGCADEKMSLAETVSEADCSFQKVAFHPLSSAALMDQCMAQANQIVFK